MSQNPNNPQRKPGEFGTGSSRFGESMQGGTSTVENLKETASSVAEKVQDTASNIGQKMQDTASNIGHKAQDAASSVVDTWEAGRHYVEERGIEGMFQDVTLLIRRNPIPALCIGVCVGFLLGRTMTKNV
jgi:ElaB/YqjD/DUF883 family membrane-anchored ribosome-binding protein